jgi:RNA polymerase sigma factor (sigma-70 family)
VATTETVEWILQQSHNYPLLTAEQEIVLARQVQAWVEIRDLAELTKEQQKIVRRGKHAYDSFFLSNIRLVVKVASRYTKVSGTLGLDDLIQEGLLGLERAIVKFDPQRGYKFSTYAFNWIRQSINRAISNKSRSIRIPCGAIASIKKANDYMRAQQRENSRVPSLGEVAQHCGVSLPTLKHYLPHSASVISLDDRVKSQSSTSETSTYLELLADVPIEPSMLSELDNIVAMLPKLLNDLAPEEQVIIKRRYMSGEDQPVPFTRIGRELGISRQTANQRHDAALRKLRMKLNYSARPEDIQALRCAA